MNTKFPIFLKPESLTFNVFGGSEIAEEKLHFMLKSSPHARVRVFADSFAEPVQALIDKHEHCAPAWLEPETSAACCCLLLPAAACCCRLLPAACLLRLLPAACSLSQAFSRGSSGARNGLLEDS